MSLHQYWICCQCSYFNYDFQYKCQNCYQHRFILDCPLDIQELCQEEIIIYLLHIEFALDYYFFG